MLNYFLMAVGSGIAAQVTLSDVDHSGTGIGIAFCNYRLHSDGTIDGSTSGGDNYTQSLGTWLDWGSASEVWVEYSNVVGGTFNHDPGAGRLLLSTSREFGILDSINDATPVVVTFDLTFYDSAAGGLPITGPTNVRLSADRTS